MIIYVDIDGTITKSSVGKNYAASEPVQEHIDKINKLYDEGHTIIYWTARGRVTGLDWRELTMQQLTDWGCKFHDVILNLKPAYDLLIDDKSRRIEEI